MHKKPDHVCCWWHKICDWLTELVGNGRDCFNNSLHPGNKIRKIIKQILNNKWFRPCYNWNFDCLLLVAKSNSSLYVTLFCSIFSLNTSWYIHTCLEIFFSSVIFSALKNCYEIFFCHKICNYAPCTVMKYFLVLKYFQPWKIFQSWNIFCLEI